MIDQLKNQIEEQQKIINQMRDFMQQQNELIEQRNKMFIGSFFYSTRCEDQIDGAIRCNGQEVDVEQFPYFVTNFLQTGKVATISITEWRELKDKNENVGYFGYDVNSPIFLAPLISAGTFISNANGSIISNGQNIVSNQGQFVNDQIVNIVGAFNMAHGAQGHPEFYGISGAFQPQKNGSISYPPGISSSPAPHGVNFDASKVVKTGDRVMPRTVFHNLYVIIK